MKKGEKKIVLLVIIVLALIWAGLFFSIRYLKAHGASLFPNATQGCGK